MDRVQIEIQIYKSTISLCFVCEWVREMMCMYEIWAIRIPQEYQRPEATHLDKLSPPQQEKEGDPRWNAQRSIITENQRQWRRARSQTLQASVIMTAQLEKYWTSPMQQVRHARKGCKEKASFFLMQQEYCVTTPSARCQGRSNVHKPPPHKTE